MLKMACATRAYRATGYHRYHHLQACRFRYTVLLKTSSKRSVYFTTPVNWRGLPRASISRHPIPFITVEFSSYLACRK